jgi:GT2 family glycosyltransferase
VGPGKESALDTLESIAWYCSEPHVVVIIDDCTQDGTYDALLSHKRANWHILRNPRQMGRNRLVQSLCSSFLFVLAESHCEMVLRLDQDALIIKPGVISDALAYMHDNPCVGLFGVYERDYDRARCYESHRKLITTELSLPKRLLGLQPAWASLLTMAERQGYRRGDNVFGGAYFITCACLRALREIGALDVPYRWHSRLMEDVYFSMAAVAAGFKLGHFAAPDGPLCLEWNGLPCPAANLAESPYKVVHSVDKGKNTNRGTNGGRTAREFFQIIRRNEAI